MLRLFLAIGAAIVASGAAQATREVCVTFDDLPIAGVLTHDAASSRAITRNLLAAIAAHHVPAIGFVNESKLAGAGGVDSGRVPLLQMWIDAGLELGNHTYAHLDLHTTPLAAFERDVVRGETVTRALLERRGM